MTLRIFSTKQRESNYDRLKPCDGRSPRLELPWPVHPAPEVGVIETPSQVLLSRLTGVRRTRSDRWVGLCPAHDDRSPSLSITETQDGTVLIHCWAGCGAEDIVKSVGLSLGALFPESITLDGRRPRQNRFNAYEVVRTACTEAMILCIAYRQVLAGKSFSPSDANRAEQAMKAITSIYSEVVR